MALIDLFNTGVKVEETDRGEIIEALALHGARVKGYDEFEVDRIPVTRPNGVQKLDEANNPIFFKRNQLAKFALGEMVARSVTFYREHLKENAAPTVVEAAPIFGDGE